MLRDRFQVFAGTGVPITASNPEFWNWLVHGSRLVAITTERSGQGKTSLGVGLLVETIVRTGDTRIPHVLRFRYINAPEAFAEIARLRFDSDSDYEHNIRHAGMLVMDDFDRLDGRDLERAVYMVKLRCDDAKSTIITGNAKRMHTIYANHTDLLNRVLEGRSISL